MPYILSFGCFGSMLISRATARELSLLETFTAEANAFVWLFFHAEMQPQNLRKRVGFKPDPLFFL